MLLQAAGRDAAIFNFWGGILSGLKNVSLDGLLDDPSPPRNACWAGELTQKCNSSLCPRDTAHLRWLLCILCLADTAEVALSSQGVCLDPL